MKTCFVAISIVAIITALQLSSTVFLGLSSFSPVSSNSKTKVVAPSIDTITSTVAASDDEIIPSAAAQGDGPPSTLNVKVVVINDNGVGSLIPPSFPVHVSGAASFPSTTIDQPGVAGKTPANFRVYSANGVNIHMSPGRFDVNIDELQPDIYTHATLGNCSGTFYGSERLSCTFIKDDRPRPITGLKGQEARLIVRTEVRNDNGANIGAEATTVRIDGNGASPNVFLGNSRPEGTVVSLLPGQYSVVGGDVAPVHGKSASASPTRPPGGIVPQFGFLRALSSECSGRILAGETKICNVFLDDAPSRSSRLILNYAFYDMRLLSLARGLYTEIYQNGQRINVVTVYGISDDRLIRVDPGSMYHISFRCEPGLRACEDALGGQIRIVFSGEGCGIRDNSYGFFSRGGNMLAGETKWCDIQIYPGRG